MTLIKFNNQLTEIYKIIVKLSQSTYNVIE